MIYRLTELSPPYASEYHLRWPARSTDHRYSFSTTGMTGTGKPTTLFPFGPMALYPFL